MYDRCKLTCAAVFAIAIAIASSPAQANVLGKMIGMGAKLVQSSRDEKIAKEANQFQHLIGNEFVDFSHVAMGFDAFDEKKDRQHFIVFNDGDVRVYPVRKRNKRFLVIATTRQDGKSAVSEVRSVAPSANSHILVHTTQEGDAGIDCKINNKVVDDAFGFAKDNGNNVYEADVSGDGEALWSINSRTNKVAAFPKGQKMKCELWFFG